MFWAAFAAAFKLVAALRFALPLSPALTSALAFVFELTFALLPGLADVFELAFVLAEVLAGSCEVVELWPEVDVCAEPEAELLGMFAPACAAPDVDAPAVGAEPAVPA